MNENEKKEIEVVSGNGSELNISEVHEHLTSMRPKSKDENDRKNIVIPNVSEKNEENN